VAAQSPPMSQPKPGALDVSRIVRATQFSLAGLRAAWREEAAFRQEAIVACVMLPLALWVGRGWLETAFLAACVLLVLLTELLNSAIEAVVDRVSTERHPLAGRAKDLGSAAVMLALVICGLAWGLALWHRLTA
jgi:diacylglycerol kinase (ATP)